jgi:hypothetical protein
MSTINLPEFVTGTRQMLEDLANQRRKTVEAAKQIVGKCIRKAILPRLVKEYPHLAAYEDRAIISISAEMSPDILINQEMYCVLFDREKTIVLNSLGKSFEIPNYELEEID